MCLPQDINGRSIQTITTLIGSLLYFNFGLIFGITPPHVELYQSATATPLNRPISVTVADSVNGILFISAAISSLCFGWISEKISPKGTLLISGILQITSWFCIHFGYDIMHIQSSRIFGGVAAGAAFIVLPIFITDISEISNRTFLMGIVDKARTLGILLGFVLGWYVEHDYVNIVGVVISCAFSLIFPFVQESPYHYKKKGYTASMTKSLRWYRGIRKIEDHNKLEFVRELKEFVNDSKENHIAETRMSWKYILKISTYCFLLMVGAQCSGVYVILNFGNEFLDSNTSVFERKVEILILAATQFLGASLSSWMRSKINRKTVLSITSLLCCFCTISLALLLTYGDKWHISPLFAPWLHLGSLMIHIFSANIGLYPLAIVITGEMLPIKIRVIISTIMMFFSWLLVFLLIELFHPIKDIIGLVGILWFFGIICIIVACFAIVFLPETFGKSLKEIQEEMGYVENENVAKIITVGVGSITSVYI